MPYAHMYTYIQAININKKKGIVTVDLTCGQTTCWLASPHIKESGREVMQNSLANS